MLYINVMVLSFELSSIFLTILGMLVINIATKIERINSDLYFLEECIKEGLIPNGFKIAWKPQGVEKGYEEKIKRTCKDTSIKIMEIMLEALGKKKQKTEEAFIMGMDRDMGNQGTWEKVRWFDKLDKEQNRACEELKKRKEKKLKDLRKPETDNCDVCRGDASSQVSMGFEGGSTLLGRGLGEGLFLVERDHGEVRGGVGKEEEEEEQEREERVVVEDWEELYVEEEVMRLGREIYDKEESAIGKKKQLTGLLRVMKRQDFEVNHKTRTDGNCFYEAVAEQLGGEASEVRQGAVQYLRENDTVQGQEWEGFVYEERGGGS
jgi:hypothetical protein